MATGGMMTASSNPYAAQYTPAELTELVLEARRLDLRVAAHALSAEGVRAAVAAGVSTLEHCVTTTSARQDYDPALNAGIVGGGDRRRRDGASPAARPAARAETRPRSARGSRPTGSCATPVRS